MNKSHMIPRNSKRVCRYLYSFGPVNKYCDLPSVDSIINMARRTLSLKVKIIMSVVLPEQADVSLASTQRIAPVPIL